MRWAGVSPPGPKKPQQVTVKPHTHSPVLGPWTEEEFAYIKETSGIVDKAISEEDVLWQTFRSDYARNPKQELMDLAFFRIQAIYDAAESSFDKFSATPRLTRYHSLGLCFLRQQAATAKYQATSDGAETLLQTHRSNTDAAYYRAIVSNILTLAPMLEQ